MNVNQQRLRIFGACFFLLQASLIVGCSDPRTVLPEEDENTEDTGSETTSESYIANTGGRAISADGLHHFQLDPMSFPMARVCVSRRRTVRCPAHWDKNTL